MRQIVLITFPTGKIFVAECDSQSPWCYSHHGLNRNALNDEFAHLPESAKKNFITRQETLWESERCSNIDLLTKKREFVRRYESDNPKVGYNSSSDVEPSQVQRTLQSIFQKIQSVQEQSSQGTNDVTNEASEVVITSYPVLIDAIRGGLTGTWLSKLLKIAELKPALAAALGTESYEDLAALSQVKALSQAQSEAILDTVMVYLRAVEVWESAEAASSWFHAEVPALAGQRPLAIMDTFEGRKWVREVLEKIDTGTFS
jgi:antitoxin Xre/MbcA/ParS-like protein